MKRFFDLRGVVLGVLLIAGLHFSGVLARANAYLDVRDTFGSAMAAVVSCTTADNSALCSRPAVRQMLTAKTGAEIMDALAVEISPQQCHYIGHVVGQQSFNKYQNVEAAIAQCNRECDSACVHGVIGESFAQELGLGPAGETVGIDLQHMTPDEIRSIGKRLCDTPENCHGVGHASFQIYSEFEPALRLCDEVAINESRRYCYQGMFMEYADVLSSRNMREVPGIVYPTQDDLVNICTQPTLEVRRACFKYFPRMVITTLRQAGMSRQSSMNELRAICSGFPKKEDRMACTVGIGAYSSYSVVTNTKAAVQSCLRFPRLIEQAACNLGQTSVATQDRQKQVIAYCAEIPRESLRSTCFQGVFFYLNLLGTPRDESRPLCMDDPICLKASELYELDPFAEVMKIDS